MGHAGSERLSLWQVAAPAQERGFVRAPGCDDYRGRYQLVRWWYRRPRGFQDRQGGPAGHQPGNDGRDDTGWFVDAADGLPAAFDAGHASHARCWALCWIAAADYVVRDANREHCP